MKIDVSRAIQSVSAGTGGGGAAISAGGNSQNTGTVNFSNSNGITFGLSNNGVFTASHNGLTTAMASNRGSDFVQATAAFNGTNASGTIASNGISVSVGNYITTARASNDAVGLNTALTAGPLAWTVNSNGISLNAGSAAGTTTGFAGNSISGSMTHNTAGLNVSLAHPAWLTTAMQSNAATISNVRVSAGTTSNLLSAVTFSNSNGVSFGLNAGTMTASHDGLTTAAQSNHSHGNPTLNLTNISGTTASNSAGLTLSLSAAAPGGGGAINVSAGTTSGNLQTVQFDNGNGVTFGLNGSTVTASVNAAGGGATKSFYENVPVIHGTQTFNAVSSTIYVYPFALDQNVSVGFVRLPFSVSVPATTGGGGVANATITGQMGFTHGFVIYTQGTGANSNSLQHFTSTSGTGSFGTTLAQGTQSSQMTVTVNGSFGRSGAQTNLGTGVSYGVSSASRIINSTALSNFTGPRFVDIPFAVSLSPGNYWVGIGRSWSSANNSSILNGVNPLSSNIFISQSNITWGIMGSATNTSNVMRQPGAGYFTTNASIISTASINAVGQISVTTSNLVPYFQFVRKA